MRSTAHFKSHPIHPMLVPFPIAFFSGTLIFDVLFLFSGNHVFFQTASHLNLAGVIASVITAIPGFIDFFKTVPPNSSGKKRAAKHGIINLNVLILFTVAYLIRDMADIVVITALDLVGMVLLSISGWMGATLVYRNQIGVDHRYADAGKWKVLEIGDEHGTIEVAEKDELKVNQMKLIKLKTKWLVLARDETTHVAFEDRCSHKGGSLAGGAMMCGIVQCPWHGSQFDVNSGEVKAGPSKEKIRVYPVQEKNGKVFIVLNEKE